MPEFILILQLYFQGSRKDKSKVTFAENTALVLQSNHRVHEDSDSISYAAFTLDFLF